MQNFRVHDGCPLVIPFLRSASQVSDRYHERRGDLVVVVGVVISCCVVVGATIVVLVLALPQTVS